LRANGSSFTPVVAACHLLISLHQDSWLIVYQKNIEYPSFANKGYKANVKLATAMHSYNPSHKLTTKPIISQ